MVLEVNTRVTTKTTMFRVVFAPLCWLRFLITYFIVTLKKFSLPLTFPYYDVWNNYKDPYQTNILYPKTEWAHETPSRIINKKIRDNIIFHGSDPDKGDQLMISFERMGSGLCQVVVVLRVDSKDYVYSSKVAIDKSEGNNFFGGGVRLECDAPMRYWRVAFNVEMICLQTNLEVHVKLGARFSSGSHSFEFPKNVPSCQLASALASSGISSLMKYCSALQSYDQTGTLYCQLAVDGEKSNPMLFGGRTRFLKNPLMKETHYYAYASNATTFHLVSNGKQVFGSCYSPAHFMRPVKNVKMATSDQSMRVSFDAYHLHYILQWEKVCETTTDGCRDNVELMQGHLTSGDGTFKLAVFKVTSLESLPNIEVPKEFLHQLSSNGKTSSAVVSTSEDVCKKRDLTGGKGSSLAVLSSLSSQYNSFIVPRAVVLTVKAYCMFWDRGPIQSAIEEMIEKIRQGHDMKEACAQCVSVLENADLPGLLQTELSSKMKETFGMDCDSMKFAVRSSAVGEDSEDMSAAGQMTTYLGVTGEQEICKAIARCWASQFAFTAVNYKRQYGQPLHSFMAVVVQEMVDAESAGVMFTCDPVTGSPLLTTITANYGLGESVVSAAADPDTFVVSKKMNQFDLIDVKVGAKGVMMMQNESGGTVTKPVSESDADKASISDEIVVQLAKVGSQVDSCYGTCRDIEWAVAEGRIFLLQCRPVTSVFKESDFEVKNDMNIALRTSKELLSRANIDEVLPGCVTTLSVSYFHYLFQNYLNFRFTRSAPGVEIEESQFVYLICFSIGMKWYTNLTDPAFAMAGREMMKSILLAIFGKDVSETDIYKKAIAHSRYVNKWFAYIMKNVYELEKYVRVKPAVKRGIEIRKTFKINVNDSMPSTLILSTIIDNMHLGYDAATCLNHASFPSLAWNMKVLGVLRELKGENPASPETMALLSKFLKAGPNVESANIPASLTELDSAIRKSSKAGDFLEMEDEEALKWLQISNEDAGKKYRAFMERHGHRCYKEFDLTSNPWELVPLRLIKMIKASLKGEAGKIKEERSLSVNDLPGKPTIMQRITFAHYLWQARYAVFARESTKASLIYCIHTMRKATRLLGRKMAEEGRIPDADLIHFFTFSELDRLLETRNPTLVERSIKRRRIFKKINDETHPVLQCGMPQAMTDPSDETILTFDPNRTQWQGTPVSEGQVRGTARVILDFENEAHLIEKGDLLITNATDTGWTPYFPLLSGIVTQVGGILSHGAVVAREYGLPAVVGVTGATQIFNTGDIVHIDGTKGIILKLEEAPRNE